MPKTSRILETTSKNVKRNKWLTISTVFVSTVVFTLSSAFISASILSQKAVDYYEQKAQVIVFFKKETPETDILSFRDKIFNPDIVEEIKYVSQEQALEIYKTDFADNPDLISTVTADSLPASIEVRAKSIDSLLTVIDTINTEKQTNPNIDEVMYFKDVVENMRTLSNIVKIASIVLISAMVIITVSLIRVTIGFNIKLHQDEIEIMHLVGSSDQFIKLPFILEGTLYGFLGGILSALLISVPWYILMYYTNGTNFAYWIQQMIVDFKLPFLVKLDALFLLIYFAIHIVSGSLIGFLSSMSAVAKYLKDE